jgi:hypothetical protein
MNFLLRRVHLVSALLAFMWATPASAGVMTLAWNPNTEPDIAGYRLRYGTTPGSHPTVVDVGNRTSWQISRLADGQRYYFVVTAYNTSGLESAPSGEVSATVVGLVTILSDASSPSPTGTPITFIAKATSNSLEYKFSRYSHATSSWTLLRDYSPSNTFTWTPTSGQTGRYHVQVWARLQGATDDYQAWHNTDPFDVGNGPVKIGSIEPSLPMPVSTGTPVTWTVKASGGPAPLQYRFQRYNRVTQTWATVQNYSTSNTVSWTPGANDEGPYHWQVWVRGNGSTASYDAWRNSDLVEVEDGPVTIAKLTPNVNFPAGTGTPVTWTADAAGGPGGLQYQFRRRTGSGSYSIVQAWGPSKQYTFTPTSAATYTVEVSVRRAGTTAAEDTLVGPSFQIANTTPASVTIESSSGPTVGTGSPLTWVARATGGPGPLQYKFQLYEHAKDAWILLRDWNSSNTASWTPGAVDAGIYNMQVWVRRPGSTAAYEAWANSTFTVAPTIPSIYSFTANTGLSASVGAPVVFTAKPLGGQGPLEYQFWLTNKATQVATRLQEYGWDNSVGWVPLVGDAGQYSVQVRVRRGGSTAAYENITTIPTFTVTP